jgi:beta-N-acetylhexosaminidase
MHLRYRLIAGELQRLGIDVNCAPVLDVASPTRIRSCATAATARPGAVAAIGRGGGEGLLAGGVLPVIKHMPGHGRAPPTATTAARGHGDRAPRSRRRFRAVPRASPTMPLAMTAHVVYAAIDPGARRRSRPPASADPRDDRLRRALMTDDLSMGALSGPIGARVAGALAAGCDLVLHCNGDPAEMEAVAAAAPRLAGEAAARAAARLPPAARGARRRRSRPLEAAADPALERASMPEDFFEPRGRGATPPRRWSSTSTASRGRSTCC